MWRLPEERIVFRNQSQSSSTTLGPRTALGVDPLGKDWAVQINEGERPGDPNVTTAVAHDGDGRPYLLHQGRLSGNRLSDPILEAEFERRTGLKPVAIENGDTRIGRSWHVVTPLDLDADEIRRRTARFIHLCVLARGGGGVTSAEQAVLDQLYADDESGGTYERGGQPARDPRLVRKYQGEVWQSMAKLLRARKMIVRKPRHAAGYEVDAEVLNAKRRLLIEIKSDASAHDVYAGVGQLLLYRRLLPSLANHVPVLLLPRRPRPPLAEALDKCGIELCIFDFAEGGGKIIVKFDDSLLELCGAGSKAWRERR